MLLEPRGIRRSRGSEATGESEQRRRLRGTGLPLRRERHRRPVRGRHMRTAPAEAEDGLSGRRRRPAGRTAGHRRRGRGGAKRRPSLQEQSGTQRHGLDRPRPSAAAEGQAGPCSHPRRCVKHRLRPVAASQLAREGGLRIVRLEPHLRLPALWSACEGPPGGGSPAPALAGRVLVACLRPGVTHMVVPRDPPSRGQAGR